MPAYDYVCDDEHLYTEERSITEEQKVTVCPVEDCGKPLKRVWSTPSTVFKGKGFYSNDKNSYLLKPGQQVDY